jgi:tRNA A-37 threonylcarbamoyl transferase component Bud32
MIIELPNELGTIRESLEGTTGKTVALIEDKFIDRYFYAKCEVRILEHLITTYDLKKIFVESGWGDVSLSYLRVNQETGEQIPEKRRIEVAEDYLRQGKISAEEYLDIVSDHDIQLIGADVEELNKQCQDIVLSLSSRLPGFLGVTSAMKRSINEVREELSDPTLELTLMEEAYAQGQATLRDLCGLYVDKAKQLGINVGEEYPTFLSVCAGTGASIPSEWMLSRFTNGSRLFAPPETVIKPKFIDEEERIKADVEDCLYKNDEQRQVAQTYRDLTTLEDIATLTAKPRSIERLKDRRYKFTSQTFSNFLRKYDKPVPERVQTIDDVLPQMERFYEICRERQNNFVDVISTQIQDENLVVLITGGFHTPAVKQLLKQKGFSYFVIMPDEITEKRKVAMEVKETGMEGYLDILRYKGGEPKRVETLSPEELTAFRNAFSEYADYESDKELGRGLYKKAIRLVDQATGEMITLKIVDVQNLHQRALRYIQRKGHPNPLAAFQHESERISSLKELRNPNISEVLNTRLSDDGRFYFFVEMYSERTLADYVSTNHPLPYDTARDVGLQLSYGLAGMHQVGLVHGDCKPDNVLWRNGIINITDFDLTSSMPDEGEKKELATYSCVLAPEMFEHDAPTYRSDLWAWAVNVYFTRMGKPAFAVDFPGTEEEWVNSSFDDRVMAVRTSVLPKIMDNTHYERILEEVYQKFDPQMAKALTICLSRDPIKRPENAVKLYQKLTS